MTWSELDWPALDRLRDGFLSGKAAQGAYWKSPADLASYDFTYGERIGWKWDHVLRELRLRQWAPHQTVTQLRQSLAPAETTAVSTVSVVDWGCGSGIAARRVIAAFGPESFSSLTVWDHSPVACDFAAEAATAAFPGLPVAIATPGFLTGTDPIGLLVISHVLNELPADALAALQTLCLRAAAILWVEPGTHAVSRQLGAIRDEILRPAGFSVVAPCTHQLACPALTPANARDWCHFFAPPPSEIFANPDWVKFGQRAGIDLRSLPYSFLALDRSPSRPPTTDLSRVIGRPEHFKPYARVLSCDATGLTELELPKRADPALFKRLERTKAPLIYRWRRDGPKLLGGEHLADQK